MVLFEKYWKELEHQGYYMGSTDKDKIRWGYEKALTWMQTRLAEGLAGANFDANVGCIQQLQRDVQMELGVSPVHCTPETRDGYRTICRQECDAIQREQCIKKDLG